MPRTSSGRAAACATACSFASPPGRRPRPSRTRSPRVTTYTHAQPGVRRFWRQLTIYLGLTGLVALMVGGIGVATSVRAFVRGKLDTIAVLKCLGVGWRAILAAYLLQTTLLGLGGSLLGAVIGSAVQWALAPLLSPLMPVPLDTGLSMRAVCTGLAMG